LLQEAEQPRFAPVLYRLRWEFEIMACTAATCHREPPKGRQNDPHGVEGYRLPCPAKPGIMGSVQPTSSDPQHSQLRPAGTGCMLRHGVSSTIAQEATMRYLDLDTWARRQHFDHFRPYDYPYSGLTANVDLTAFYPAVKVGGYSLTVAMIYVITRAANAIPEFRYRIRDKKVVEHEVVHAGFTFLVEEDVFSFCLVDYVDSFPTFAASAAAQIARVKEHPWVHQVSGDDVLYMTAIPWVSFTAFLHPVRLQPADSVPRFAWGKFFQEGERLKMPLNVQGHHALIDGVHMGRFYAHVQDSLQRPEVTLGSG
jgi:chloramphenicol O-acetyltransferase type A